MRGRNSLFLGVFVVLVLAVAGSLSSQTVQGVITGTVTDPSGAVVPKVAVTITNEGTSASQSATTGSDGIYHFPLVPPGIYTIDVKAAGFAEMRATGVLVQASQTVPFNIRLQLAKTSAVVEVTGQAPLVQTATSDQATSIDRNVILNAPLVDRDVFSTLPFLAPQVTPGLDLAPTAGGARESGTSYLLNGGDDNDNFSEGAINIHPPLESVQNFTLISNNMSAQYGRGAGEVVSANQRSGGNGFHGALYEFNRNASLNANDFFYNRDLVAQQSLPASQQLLTPRPKYIRNQFGGEIDGPIKKNKSFFSFAYDRIKLLSGVTSANNFVPTAEAIAFVKANGGPIAQQILSARPPVTSELPCPNNPGTGAGSTVGCLSFFDPQTDTQDSYYGRFDQNFSSSDRLSFVANIFRETFDDKFGGAGLTTKGGIPADTLNHFHQLSVNETHLFSPRLLNEFSISHNRHYNVFVEGNGTADTLPNIFIDNQNEGSLGYNIGGDLEGGQLQGFVQDRWGLTDNLTFTTGPHSLKFGFGGTYGILYRNWDLGLPGFYEFGEIATTDPSCATKGNVVTPACDGTLQPDSTIANVTDETRSNLAGEYPYFQETAVNPQTGARGNAYRHYTYHDYDVFAQDDYKVSPRLTLNLGVRWDRYGAPSEDHGILAQFTKVGCNLLDAACIGGMRVGPVGRMWPTQNHDFAPRIGFAWDVFGNGKTALRGGYGIFYDRIFDNIWSNGAWNPPFYALIDFESDLGDANFYSNPASIGPAYNPNGPCGPIPYGPNPATGCTGNKRVSVRTMDQNMKDASGQNFYFDIERQLLSSMMLRLSYQGSLGRHLPMLENYNRVDGIAANKTLTPRRPNPLYTGFNYRSDSVSSNYNALVVEVQKRMSAGLEFDTSYTFSKLLDVNSDLFAGCSTIGGFTAPYYYISNNRPGLSYGPASDDHRHSYKFNVDYNLPFFRAQRGFVGHAFGGWTVGSFFQYYFGHPLGVRDGRTRFRARDAAGHLVLDRNGIPINLGGDYNLDGVLNDEPMYVGSSVGAAYGHGSPADGWFSNNNPIGCGASWVPSNVANVAACNARFGATTPNSLFATAPYPGSGPTFERFGTLGRNVFHGPAFASMDFALSKSFPIKESYKLDFRFQAQNLFNHPNFDCIDSNLNSSTFGRAQCLIPFGIGAPKSRVMSLGLRLSF